MNRALFLAMALVSMLGGATDARAEGTRSEARAVAEQGDAQFYAGRCDRAIALWRRAFGVYPAPTILLRIAQCEALVGRVVAAAATLEEILAEDPPPDTPAIFAAARDEARRELPVLRARIATLRVDVHPRGVEPLPGAPAIEIEIEVDGAPAPTNGAPIPLDPGAHRLRVRAARARWEREVRLEDGEALTIDVPLLVEPLPTVSPRQRTAGLSTFGAGMVSVVTGVGFAVSALSTAHALTGACGAGWASCPPSARGGIDRVRDYSIAADAALAGGGVLVVGGAVLLTTDLRSRRESGVRILASPRGLTVAGEL
jgi:hypothetical protein